MSPDFLVEKIFLDVSNLTVSLEEATKDFSTKQRAISRKFILFALEIKTS